MTRLILIAALMTAWANPQDAPAPAFEVVSIKPTPNPPVRTGMFPIPGTLTIGNYTLKRLVMESYRIKNYQLYGAVGWMDSEHYDIVGKAAGKANMGEMVKMVIPMMADRFQLKIHRETRELPIYALTVAKSGLKMKPATETDKVGSFRLVPNAITEMTSVNMGMRMFSGILSGQLDRPVLDETGLTENFQITLRYVTDDLRPQPGDADSGPDPNGASIYAAIQEQLGLKLEARKGPVECIVIDHAERPAAN
jgi:uncharacterized protein (TIGR03435 family)